MKTIRKTNRLTSPLLWLIMVVSCSLEYVYADGGVNNRLQNLATRGFVGDGDNVLIGGLVIRGDQPKTVVIRAKGPSLADAGVPNPLADPQLTLFSGSMVIDSNDSWQDHANVNLIPEDLKPGNPLEAVIAITLDPGPYTAIVGGVGGGQGIGIVEVFEISNTGATRLQNIATRGFVGTGDDVLIGGLVIAGTERKKLVIRAKGPSLAEQGVPGALADPQVTIFSGSSVIDSNDNWRDHVRVNSVPEDLKPTNDLDATLYIELDPGPYTAIVSGVGDAVGVGIVEVFEVDDADVGPGDGSGDQGITFDDPSVTYSFTDFGDPVPAATMLGADPTDAGNMVAVTNKPPGTPLWAGTTVDAGMIVYPLTATDSQIMVRVYSPDAGIPVRLKVEDAADPTHSVETEALTTVANTWEVLTFDFNNEATGTAALNPAYTFDKLSIFFNFGTDGDTAGDKTYYWENVTFDGGGGSGGTAFMTTDFEPVSGAYVFSDFGGGVATVIANPQNTGINTSATVGQMQKFAGEVFGGSTLTLNGEVDFTGGDAFTMKVYATRSVDVLFKLEGLVVERSVTHSGSGWEELSFDFTGDTGAGVTAITLIFDLGVMGDADGDPANWTFLFDDITQVAGGGSGGGTGETPSVVSFETDAEVMVSFTDFGDPVPASTMLGADPSGATNTVAITNKPPGTPVWAGTTIAPVSGTIVYPLTATDSQITVRVYSPDAGIPVRLKAEDAADPTHSVETEAMTTMANAWEVLTFDFSNEATGTAALNPSYTFDKLSIFFNFGTDGDTAGDKTYYWDDVTFIGGTGSGGSGGSAFMTTDFEPAGGTYTFSDFGGGVATVIANPQMTGINTSATVGQMQKFAGEVFGGSTLTLNGEVDFTGGDAFTMKVYATRSVDVLFKLEGLVVERSVTHTGSGWEELSFDFTGDTGAGVTAITLIFDLGVMGDADGDAANWTFLFDDITQVTPGGSGGSAFMTTDFEPAGGTSTFSDFGGGVATVIANPQMTGINTSATVGQMQKFAGEVFGGSTLTLNGEVDFTGGDAFTMKVYATRSVDVLFKLEGLVVERSVTHSGSGWEELSFDFTGDTGAGVTAITLIFDLGVMGDADGDSANWTFLFDDITQVTPGGSGGSAFMTTDFEPAGGTYTFSDFGGGVATVIANPQMTGINTSATVGQMQKFAGEVFGGSTLTLNGEVDFSAGDAFTMKVYATRSVDVLFKLEGLVVERSVTHAGSGWEELSFDFTGDTGAGVTAITLIFDLGVMGDADGDSANWTFLFDDITQVAAGGSGGGTGEAPSVVSFETDAAVMVSFTDFGDPVPASTMLGVDPSGATNTVAITNKPPGTPVWAGTTIDPVSGTIVYPLTATDSQITVRVYSPDAGIPVRLKAEDAADPTHSVETEAMTTMANAWEVLTFDFNNEATGTAALNPAYTFDKLSIFFNFGTDGDTAGDKTYYWDDVTFIGGTGSGGSGGSAFMTTDFEPAGGTYTFSDFGGGVATVIANPQMTGINTSATVGQMQKFAGEVFGGSTLTLNGEVDFTGGDAFTMRVYATRSVDVLFKLEGLVVERSVTHTGSGWEELSFDFTGDTGAGVTAITLIFDLGVMGDAEGDAANWTFLFDDITQVAGGGSGGGEAPPVVSFETDAEVMVGFTDFGDPVPASTMLGVDPSGATNTVAITNKPPGTPLWAGTTIDPVSGTIVYPLTATNSQITVRVYSPDAGIPVRLKVEDAADPTHSVETEAVTTMANAWEILTFDFNNEADGTAALNPSYTFNKLSIFFNFGTDGDTAGDKTYHWDDVTFVGS